MSPRLNEASYWSIIAGVTMAVVGGMFFVLGNSLQANSWIFAGYGLGVIGGWITSGSILLHALNVPLRASGSAWRQDGALCELDELVWVYAPASVRTMISELSLTPMQQAMVWRRAQSTRHLAPGIAIFVLATLAPLIVAPVILMALGVALWDRYEGRLTSRYERRLFRAIVELGFAEICVECGYRLDTIDPRSPHCPECGMLRRERESS